MSDLQALYADSIKSALLDIDSRKCHLFVRQNQKENTKLSWYEFVGSHITIFRKQVFDNNKLCSSGVRVLPLWDSVLLWLTNRLIDFNLAHLTDETLIRIQRNYNQAIQQWLDVVFFDGDAYLTALTIKYSAVYDDIFTKYLPFRHREAAMKELNRRAAPAIEFIEPLLKKTYSTKFHTVLNRPEIRAFERTFRIQSAIERKEQILREQEVQKQQILAERQLRNAEREAEKAKRKAEREAANLKRKAEREAEKLRLKTEREAMAKPTPKKRRIKVKKKSGKVKFAN